MPSRDVVSGHRQGQRGHRALARRVQRPLRQPDGAAIEQVLTIAALGERRRCGSAARDTRAMPTTLTFRTRCHSSSLLAVDVADRADAGVVDQDVDAAERVGDRGDAPTAAPT